MVDSILLRDKSKTHVIKGTPSSTQYKYMSPASRRLSRVQQSIERTRALKETSNARKTATKRHSGSSHRRSSSTSNVVKGTPKPAVVTPTVSIPTLKSKPIDTPVGSRIKSPRKIDKPKQLSPNTFTTRNKVQRDTAPSSSVNLRTDDRTVYSSQNKTPSRFSVSTLSLAGRESARATKPRSDEELKDMRNELAKKIRSSYYTTKLKQHGYSEQGTINPTEREIVLKEGITKTKSYKSDMKRYNALTSALIPKPKDDELNRLHKLETQRVNVERATSGSMIAGEPSQKELSTAYLKKEAEYYQSTLDYNNNKVPYMTRPTTVLAYKLGGKDAPAVKVLQSDRYLRGNQAELSRRNPLTLTTLKKINVTNLRPVLQPKDLPNDLAVKRAKTSLTRGAAVELAEVGVSMGVSAAAAKAATTSARAFKVVRAIDRIDQVQDVAQAGYGVYQLSRGDVVGGTQNLANLGITEFAAGHASKSVSSTLSFSPDESLQTRSLKDRFFPKGTVIEYEGSDLSGMKYKTSPGIERINAQLRGRKLPTDLDLPAEIQLKSGKIQSESGELFSRTKQYGVLQSVGGKDVRRNTFKESWKGMWRSKKGIKSMIDVTDRMSSGLDFTPDADFTPSSRFDITVKPDATVKPDVVIDETVKPRVDPNIRHTFKPSIRYSGSIHVSPDLTTKPDITSKPDITFKPDITPNVDNSVRYDIDTRTRPDTHVSPDLTTKPDITFKPDYTFSPDLSIGSGLTPALSALIGKPKRGRRHVIRPRGLRTYTVENKILDISKPFKNKLKSYNRIKIPLGKKSMRSGRIYLPKKLTRFM